VPVIVTGASLAATEVAPGVIVEERVQAPGECAQSDSGEHVFVLQSRPVTRAQQVWEGKRREGSMPAGEVSILPAGLPMAWQWAGDVQSLHVRVSSASADDLAGGLLRRGHVDIPPLFSVPDRLVRHLLEALRADATGYPDMLKAEQLIQHVLTRVDAGLPAAASRARRLSTSCLNAVLDGIDEHLAESISTAQLAALAGVETSWFTRLFSATVGCSPYQYVLRRRVVHAQHALRAGATPAAAAAQYGFADQAHLTRHFRRLAGRPPAAWVRAARS
jgi:AraC family transcriptional regulator